MSGRNPDMAKTTFIAQARAEMDITPERKREGGVCPPATRPRDRRSWDRFHVPSHSVCEAQAHVAHSRAPLMPGVSSDRSDVFALFGLQEPLDIPLGSRCSLLLLPVLL